MGDMAAGKVFISHCVRDHSGVHDLVRYLEARDILIWIAPRDVRPGLDYSEQIQEAIEQCSAFVVIVTEAANASLFVRAETEMAFSSRRPIFPVRFGHLEPAKGLRLFLNIHHWTNAFGAETPLNLQRLASELTALSHAAGGPAAAPPEAALEPKTVSSPEEPRNGPELDAVDRSDSVIPERVSFLTRPRAAMAGAVALLLSVPLFWSLASKGGDAVQPLERPAEEGARLPSEVDSGSAEAESGAKRASERRIVQPVASPPAQSERGRSPRRVRTAAPSATTPRRATSRPAAASVPSPIQPTSKERSMMRCRSFTVTEGRRSDQLQRCTAPRGTIQIG